MELGLYSALTAENVSQMLGHSGIPQINKPANTWTLEFTRLVLFDVIENPGNANDAHDACLAETLTDWLRCQVTEELIKDCQLAGACDISSSTFARRWSTIDKLVCYI